MEKPTCFYISKFMATIKLLLKNTPAQSNGLLALLHQLQLRRLPQAQGQENLSVTTFKASFRVIFRRIISIFTKN